LLFLLTDPSLEEINCPKLEKWGYILGKCYATYTKNRIDYLERMKNDDSFRFVFDEDLQYLPKEYYVKIFYESLIIIRKCIMTLSINYQW